MSKQMEHKNKWKFSNIQKRVIKLQVAFTNFIKTPLKFIIFCGINHEKNFSCSNKIIFKASS